MNTLRIMPLFFAAGVLGLAASCSPDGGGSGDQEICNNQIDDDGDGFTDCDDSECTNALNCTAQCGNGQCEAGETATSCPADCSVASEICNNQMDDDGDGFTDCDDADCTTDPACTVTAEICNNQIDDDGDGLIDCDDSDCTSDPACTGGGGELSCVATNYCMSACCGASDTECQSACAAAATSTAANRLQAIDDCASASCATECGSGGNQTDCGNCMDAHCATQIDACGFEPVGTSGCMTLNNCLVACSRPSQSGTAATCPTDPGLTCIDGCYADADQQGVDTLQAVNDCVDAQCPTECDTTDPNYNQTTCQNCYQAACSTEISACQSDG